MKGMKGPSLEQITQFIKIFVVKNPERSVDRNFSGGGQHHWPNQTTHHFSGGRGVFGTYWECKNPNCKYYDQASLYDTIAGFPGCSSRCTQCGDWRYNCRETCPVSTNSNSNASENIFRYHCEQSDGWRFMYSSSPSEKSGWSIDGVSFRTPLHGVTNSVPVFEYHYDQSNTYGGWRFLYSTNSTRSSEGWTLDGIKFFAFNQPMPNTVPIYEHMFLQKDGARFLLSQNQSSPGWKNNAIAFWAYPGDVK